MFGIKYRPRKFSEVVGQNTVIKTVQNYLFKGDLPQSIALIGNSGCGKSTTARIVAMTLNCEHPIKENEKIEPCGCCASCKDIINERFDRGVSCYNGADLVIDEMRKLEEDLKYDSMIDENKVIIIEEAQMVPSGAFKEFLTMLEVERKNVHFILTSTSEEKFSNSYAKDNKSREGNAFRSRISLLKIKSVTTDEISEHLFAILNQIDPDGKIDERVIDLIPYIAYNSKNNVRQALNDFETCINSECYDKNELGNLLGYVDEEKESEVVIQLAMKDKRALKYIQNADDLAGNVPYWYSIISSNALRDLIDEPFNNEYKEKVYKLLKSTNNIQKLFGAFNKSQQLCMNYFNPNVFISCIYDYYLENDNCVSKTTPSVIESTDKPIKKIKKISS